jgi:galactokinase
MSIELTQKVKRVFNKIMGTEPQLIVRAPGRVNLIGEHTDYNGGFVLPCAISIETQIASQARTDSLVRVVAADFNNATDQFDLNDPIEHHSNEPWANYVRGIFSVLQTRLRLGSNTHSTPPVGIDLVIAGNIPQGAGLSSSASLSVAVALTLKELWNLQGIDPTDIAKIAQTSESDFVGCKCGIMDQLVSTRGSKNHALLIDCDTLVTKPVSLPVDLAIMIVHSGISRGLVDGEYNLRRAQCELAAKQLGCTQLRDATLSLLEQSRADMDDTVFRRARHVITENARTEKAALFLEKGDLPALGLLLAESHRSMKEDFEITVPGIDQLVEVLQAAIGTNGGARMTGGGFGGAAVALMSRVDVDKVRESVLSLYRTPDDQPPVIMIEHAVAGAGSIELTRADTDALDTNP